MDTGFSTAVKKLGTIGCTVRIMRKGVKLPHEVTVLERHEAGLPALEEIAMIKPEISTDNQFDSNVVSNILPKEEE